MGSSGSKQARKLPSDTIARASTNLKHSKPKGANLQYQRTDDAKHSLNRKHIANQRSERIRGNRDNQNVDKIGQIRIEEIPLKLDENSPTLQGLRNKQKREEDLAKEAETEALSYKTVNPSVLCAIIDDLDSRTRDQIKVNYRVDDDFLDTLGDKLSIARTKIELPEDNKIKPLESDDDKRDTRHPLEKKLENFLSEGRR